VGTVAGSYLSLARCSMGGVERLPDRDNVRYRLVDAPAAKTASILGVVPVPAGLFYTVPAPVLELRFAEAVEGTVSIEARTAYGGYVLEPRVWPLVQGCAGTPLTLTPPLSANAP
jgi:hypothetical protein